MIEYRIDATRQLIISTTNDRLDFFAVSQLIERLMRDPEFQPGFDALVIARGPNAVPTLKELRLLAPIVAAWSERRAGARWAFVLPSPLALGMAALVVEQLALTFVTVRCFSHEQSALGWLAKGRIDAAIDKAAEPAQKGVGGASGPSRERRDSAGRVSPDVPALTRRATAGDEVRPFQTGDPR